MGLRLKSGVLVGVLLVAVLGAYGVFFLQQTERARDLQALQDRAVLFLRTLAVPAAAALKQADEESLESDLEDLKTITEDLGVKSLAVLDPKGQAIAHSDPARIGSRFRDRFSRAAIRADGPLVRENRKGVLRVSAPIGGARRLGTLRADFSLAGLDRAIVHARRDLTLRGLIFAMVLALIVYAVLSHLFISPVVRMGAMATRVSRGQLNARVELRRGDEMGQLGRALNIIADKLQSYASSLESHVERRIEELATTNNELVEANERLQRLAITDSLTGLHNRRHFMDQLEMEVRRGERIHHQFTVILIDVDHFKNFNDNRGHTQGDELLQHLAACLEANTRATDLVARYGGEEFVILLLGTGLDEGYATACKLQQAVAAHPFPHEECQPGGRLTISVGVAFYPHDSSDSRMLVDYADEALYRSKELGRNRVTRFDQLHSRVGGEAHRGLG